MKLTEDSDLMKRFNFIIEADKLKTIYRQTYLMDKSRHEDDAEHSWHIALMAVLLSDRFAGAEKPDLLKVIKMALIHDIVEIDAGDTFVYDMAAHGDKADRETRAAERLFGLLPDDARDEMRGLWEEFEGKLTPEARFAAALDRLQPVMSNYFTQGGAWRDHGIKASQVIQRNLPIADFSPELWEFFMNMITDSIIKGYLEDDQ